MSNPEVKAFKFKVPGSYAYSAKYGIGAFGATREEASEKMVAKIMEHLGQSITEPIERLPEATAPAEYSPGILISSDSTRPIFTDES